MAKRRRHEEHENLERWLVSYADFITLLFAFFVVMYAISAVNEGKYRVLSNSLEKAFKQPAVVRPINPGEPARSLEVMPLGENPATQRNEKQIESPVARNPGAATGSADEAELDGLQQELEGELTPLVSEQLALVTRKDFWLEVELNSDMLFLPGSARLRNKAEGLVVRLGGILGKYDNHVRVEGYTDNLPVNSVQFPTNWELSAARASSVVHLMEREGLNPEHLAVIGYGEHRAAYDNSLADGRRRNRRVLLIVLEKNAPAYLLDMARAGVPVGKTPAAR